MIYLGLLLRVDQACVLPWHDGRVPYYSDAVAKHWCTLSPPQSSFDIIELDQKSPKEGGLNLFSLR
jgi:hypothetical protein